MTGILDSFSSMLTPDEFAARELVPESIPQYSKRAEVS